MGPTLAALLGSAFLLSPAGDRQSPVSRVQDKFEKVAIEIFKGYVRELPPPKQRELSKMLELEKKELPGQLGKMLMHASRDAFTMTSREAERILEGRFANRANRDKSTQALKLFDELGVELPDIIKLLRPIVKKDRDLKLEFATRFLQLHLKKLARALDGK